MGYGSWSSTSYVNHSTSVRGFDSMDSFLTASTQELYRSHKLQSCLNPYKTNRECVDSAEHPNTIPVILALDVTGSMGSAASAVAKQLNNIMENLYNKVTDVEFMTMAIGDFSYDSAPLQVSQFESDIRIAEQLEKIYFEAGGGGNKWESYTAAWYYALNHTSLDCWKRGKKGIIITMGDEMLNPYLPKSSIHRFIGDYVQGDVDTNDLYNQVIEKFDVYHLGIDDENTMFSHYKEKIQSSFGKLLGQRYIPTTLNKLPEVITAIVMDSLNSNGDNFTVLSSEITEVHTTVDSNGYISW